MFQTRGTRFEFVATSQAATARALGREPQSSRHASPPWKEWAITAYNKKRPAVWCVFINVCVCTWKYQWAGLAATVEKENGAKESGEEKSGGVTNWGCAQRALCAGVAGGSHTHERAYTHAHTPFSICCHYTPPWGTFHSEAAPTGAQWAHMNNRTNKEKVSPEKKMEWAEERHEGERRGGKCSDSSSSSLNSVLFSLTTMSHCFSEGGGERGKTTGIVECMSLIHYPHLLVFIASPIITVALTYINTTVISFGKRSTYDIDPQQTAETETVYVGTRERDGWERVCLYTLPCSWVCGALTVYTRSCSLCPLRSSDHLTSWLALGAGFGASCQICYPTVPLHANKNLRH